MNAPRSSLAPFAHMAREPDPQQGFEAARSAYLNSGLILINQDWLGEWDRAQAVILAEKLFGKRKGQR